MSKNNKHTPELLDNDFKFKTGVLLFLGIGIILFFKAFFNPPAGADLISQWYPMTKFRVEYFFKYFTMLLWNPYQNGGCPELDAGFPFSVSHILTLQSFGNMQTSITFAYLITIMLGAIFAFIYFRSLKINNYAAFLASIIYMLSGSMVTLFYPGHIGKPLVMALIPLTLYLTDKGFKTGKIIYFPLSGFLMGLSFMRHPQIFYYFLVFYTCYFLFRLYHSYKKEKKISVILNGAVWFGLLGITALLIASPSLYHQYFYQKLTSRGTLKSSQEMWNFATSWSSHPLELLTFFIPSLFGLYDSTYLGWMPFVQKTNYIGVITIFLAIIGIITYWKNKYIKFNLIALIIILIFGFGKHFEPFYRLFFNYFPLIKKFRVPSSIYLVATFIFIYLAFYGISALFKAKNDKKIKNIIKKTIIAFVIFIFIISIWIHTDNYTDTLLNNISPQNIKSDNGLKRQVAQIIQQHGWKGERYIKNNIVNKTADMASSDMWKMWLWVALFVIFYFMFVSNKIKIKTFKILLAAVILLDLYIVDKKFIHTMDNYDIIDKETSAIKYLKQDKSKFRILPLLNTNEANKWALFGIESVRGYHAAGLKLYEDVMKTGLLQDLNFFGLFNGKYIISTRPLNINNFEKVSEGADKRIVYKNKKFMERFFLLDKYIVIPDPEQVLLSMKQKKVDYAKTIILEKEPKIDTSSFSIKDNTVKMTEWTPDKITFKCNVKNQCFLFLSEIYYPKWKAYINKDEIEVYKSNYLFRSVILKKGEYDLVFKFYNNGSYIITALIHYILSIIAIAAIIRLVKKKDA